MAPDSLVCTRVSPQSARPGRANAVGAPQSLPWRTSRAAGLLLVAFVATGCGSSDLASPSEAPPPAATRDGRFIQDIEALAKDLPRLHPNLFFKTTREAFDREVEGLKTRVAGMRDAEIVTGLMRITALPGDAHTVISPFGYPAFRRLPIRMTFLADGLIVTRAAPGGESLLGGRVVEIGDLAVDAAVGRVAPAVSRDNDAWLRAVGPNYLIIPEILHAQGVVADPDRVRIAVLRPDGTPSRRTLRPWPRGAKGRSPTRWPRRLLCIASAPRRTTGTPGPSRTCSISSTTDARTVPSIPWRRSRAACSTTSTAARPGR